MSQAKARLAATLAELDVSRETLAKLELYEAEIKKWQRIKNLVAPSTLDDIWGRHFEDSLQLLKHAAWAQTWLDLGSGAGFPGLVIAIALSHKTGVSVKLVESDHRKCAFLREIARATGAPAEVIAKRIEDAVPAFPKVDVVTARALTALPRLLQLAWPQLEKGAVGYFLKGQDVELELTQDPIFSMLELEFLPSSTSSGARIVQAKHKNVPVAYAPAPEAQP